mmetsp:Transcript_7233/g.18899  ORF Transcript_7233/g.18899 Transcript_7233/m.18899 type:complete len:232 (-) Transcript_7233:1000-1695(-)
MGTSSQAPQLGRDALRPAGASSYTVTAPSQSSRGSARCARALAATFADRHPKRAHEYSTRDRGCGQRLRGQRGATLGGVRMARSDTMLILPGLGDVTHPLDRLVVGFLEDLEEAHVQPRCGKHGDLEVHHNRRAAPRLVPHGGHHLDLAGHEVLRVPRESAQLPDDSPLGRLVLALAGRRGDVGLRRVLRQWDFDDDVGGEELEGEHGLDLDIDFETRSPQLLDHRQHAEG